jgi:hypothetical protein
MPIGIDQNEGYFQDDLFQPDKPLTEILGARHLSQLTANAKRATYADLLRKMGYTLKTSPATVDLSDEDLRTIAEALAEKTGWTYTPTIINACCSCLPNR